MQTPHSDKASAQRPMAANGNSALRSLRFVLGEFNFTCRKAGIGITSAEYALEIDNFQPDLQVQALTNRWKAN